MKLSTRTLVVLLGLVSLQAHGQINDCADAVVVCNSENLAFNPQGPGYNDFADPDNIPGCIVSLEQNSAWYYFEIDPNAPPNLVLGFTISPNGGQGEDYDWALYGPDVNCGDLGAPIRCSSSSAQCAFCPETGMGMGTTDFSEGPGTGDGFVSTLVVQPGQGFYLLIDNWLGTNNGFVLSWTGSAAPYLNCDAQPPCALAALAGMDISACEGETFQLDGDNVGGHGGETYLWSGTNGGTGFLDDPTLPDPTVTLPPGFTGSITYTLTVMEDTCVGEDLVDVLVHALPTINITPVGPLCQNHAPVILAASPGGGTWGGTTNGSTFNPMTMGPGIHEVTYTFTDNFGCTNTGTMEIEVWELPEISISPDPAEFCDSENSVVITASSSGGAGSYEYSWSTPSGPGTDPFYEATLAGLHTVTVTDANGCSNTSSITVVTYANPTVEIIDPGPICTSVTFYTLSALPSGGEWDGPIIDINGELTPNTVTPGTYSVTYYYEDNHGCPATDQANIIIAPIPNAIANNNGPACASQQIMLLGSTDSTNTMVSYQWTGPNGYTSNLQSPADVTVGGTYVLQVAINGCVSQPDTTIVQVFDTPNAIAQNDGPYCTGETIHLFGTTDSTGTNFIYSWTGPNGYTSNQQNPIDATEAGTYSLVISEGGCPSIPALTDVVFSAPPDVQAANSGPYCTGDAIVLSGSTTATGNVITYAWTGPNGYQSSAQNPTDAVDAGTYQLIIDVDGCASLPATTTVSINPLPQPAITGPLVFCTGSSSLLDAGPGYAQYVWSDASTSQTLAVTSTGIYAVTVTTANGCTGVASVSVTEQASLSPTINGSLSFCEGSGTVLDVGSGYMTYLWSTGDNTPSIPVTNAANYSVTVTDATGCSGVAAVTTTIHLNPVVMIGGSSTYCIGGYTILDAGAGYVSYLWSNDSTTQSLTVAAPGLYSVSVVDPFGCAGSGAVQVDESTSLHPIITGTPAFCENGNTTLNAGTGFTTYQWSDGSFNQNLLVNTAGTYTVTVSDATGCSGTSSVMVMEVTPPAAVMQNNTALCQVSSGSNAINLFDLVLSGDNTGSWIDVDQSGAAGPFNNLDFATVPPGNYHFTYTTNSAIAPCPEATYDVTVMVQPQPVVTIAQPGALDCAHATLSLDANGSSAGPLYAVDWSGPGIVADGQEHSLNPTINQAGTYSLTITNTTSGCVNTGSITVSASTPPPTDAMISSQSPSCFGDQDGLIQVSQVIGGMPPYSYQINNQPPGTDPIFDQLDAGDYTLLIEDANGCLWDTLISLAEPSAVSVSLGPDIEIGLGETALVQADINIPLSEVDTVIWSPADVIACVDPTCLQATIHTFNTVSLQATVVDLEGCEATDAILITLNKSRRIYIPNSFSPNEDGVNDMFFIQGDAGQISLIRKLVVFSRWGEEVFYGKDVLPNDPSKGWDGRLKNQRLNPGVYLYYAEVEYNDGFVERLHGDVTLVR